MISIPLGTTAWCYGAAAAWWLLAAVYTPQLSVSAHHLLFFREKRGQCREELVLAVIIKFVIAEAAEAGELSKAFSAVKHWHGSRGSGLVQHSTAIRGERASAETQWQLTEAFTIKCICAARPHSSLEDAGPHGHGPWPGPLGRTGMTRGPTPQTVSVAESS